MPVAPRAGPRTTALRLERRPFGRVCEGGNVCQWVSTLFVVPGLGPEMSVLLIVKCRDWCRIEERFYARL